MLALVLAAAAYTAQPPVVERTPNLYRVPAGCRDARENVVDRSGRQVVRRLGDLPQATAQLLVDRRVNGCPVITVMGRGVMPAPDQPNPPASQYRVSPLKPGVR
jgi:hypothetical protein